MRPCGPKEPIPRGPRALGHLKTFNPAEVVMYYSLKKKEDRNFMPKILSAQNGEKRQNLATLIGLSVFGNFRDTRGFYWLLQLLVEFIGGQMAVALRGIQQYKATTSP